MLGVLQQQSHIKDRGGWGGIYVTSQRQRPIDLDLSTLILASPPPELSPTCTPGCGNVTGANLGQ